jgi:CheY-like chemotaxis protein
MSEKNGRDSILVIDDNSDFRELIAMIGQLSGVRVLEAADCRKGLKVIANEGARIKLIFLDYFMPGMEPGPCAQEIISKAGPVVPVVLVTAASDPAVRAAELQITQWIAKPVDPSLLTQLMTQDGPERKCG